jgi:hypothetical protein
MIKAHYLFRAFIFLPLVSGCIGESVGEFPQQEEICALDTARELTRAVSAINFPDPVIDSIKVNGSLVWRSSNPFVAPTFRPGDQITLIGSGLGNGPDIDFTKLMIGNSRVLETDLVMYKQVRIA